MPAMSDTAIPIAFPAKPGVPTGHSTARLFWILLARVALFAAFVDVLLLVFFLIVGSPAQTAITSGCILLYGAAFYLLKHRRNRPAVALISAGVVVHAAIGTVLAGWGSGFHYYLLMFVPVVVVGSPPRKALWMLTILWSLYLSLLFATQTVAPLQPIKHQALLLLQAFNASILCVMVTYFTLKYTQLASVSDRKLRLLATTDSLTGLFNRRHANEIAMREASQGGRACRPLSFILADIDHFKTINDQYGHEGGDAVLVEVSKALSSVTRAQDILARWGGEEFLLVLPDTSREGAAELAHRIHQMMQTLRPMVGAAQVPVTLTMGVSSQLHDEGFSTVLARADQALYEGKRAGRNCVRLDAPVMMLQDNPARSYFGCSHAA